VDEKRVLRIPGVGTRLLSPPEIQELPPETPGEELFPGEGPGAFPGREGEGGALPQPGGKHRGIILLITQVDYLHSAPGESFHYKLIRSFEKRLSLLGYNLIFKPVSQEGIVRETILGASPRGIIFDSYNQDSYYQEAAGFGLSCVSVNHYTPRFTSIVSNNFDGAYELTQRLVNAGHRRIAFITGKSSHQTNLERLNGVRSLCASRGIPLRDEYYIPGDWTFGSGAEAAAKLLELRPSRRPTAVFAFNDDLADGCYRVFKEAGFSVPADISLAGFDNSGRYGALFPPITTVDVNLSAIVDYASWYLNSSLCGWSPRGSAKIQIDTAIRDNGTIQPPR
jgi:DNA-binding LacI/PurR family transcriptional regulator